MARTSWLSDDNVPSLDEHLEQLEHFTASLADGVIDGHELRVQEAALVDAMRAVEPLLDDALHARVTELLVELTAYNVMSTLHGLTAERLAEKFSE